MGRTALLSAILSLAPPAFAAPTDWIDGEWCTLTGGLLYVREDGIGFNEHTICSWPSPPSDPPFISVLYCANLYADGDNIVKGFHKTLTIAVEPEANNSLRVTMGDSSLIYERCDI